MNERSFETTLERARIIDGWMTDDQARRLWDRASELKRGDSVVEIGSFRGKSAVVLATAVPEDVSVVAVDPHAGNDRGPNEWEGKEAEAAEDYVVFHKNLAAAGVADRVRHVRKFSEEALADIPGPITLLYIDGAHRWGPASRDIKQYGDRVPDDHVMLIHDSFSSVGVTAALVTELFFSGRFRYEGRSQSMTQYRRTKLRGVQRVRNALRQSAELPWFLRNVAIKVLITLGLGRYTRVLGHDGDNWPY